MTEKRFHMNKSGGSVGHILAYVNENLPSDNYKIEIKEVGKYV